MGRLWIGLCVMICVFMINIETRQLLHCHCASSFCGPWVKQHGESWDVITQSVCAIPIKTLLTVLHYWNTPHRTLLNSLNKLAPALLIIHRIMSTFFFPSLRVTVTKSPGTEGKDCKMILSWVRGRINTCLPKSLFWNVMAGNHYFLQIWTRSQTLCFNFSFVIIHIYRFCFQYHWFIDFNISARYLETLGNKPWKASTKRLCWATWSDAHPPKAHLHFFPLGSLAVSCVPLICVALMC